MMGAKRNLSARRMRAIVRRLEKAYGPRPWRKHGPPLDGLIRTILSQNTSDVNSGAAFDELQKRFATWEQVRRAPVRRIAAAIRSGGLARQKAPCIKSLLNRLYKEKGNLSLGFLADWPLDEAKRYLSGFDGVGPKTAACVLMFHFNRPALPVDTHVHRIARRLGLIGEKTSAGAAHDLLEKACPDALIYPFHVLLIQHARRTCRARNPKCGTCCLNEICPSRDLES